MKITMTSILAQVVSVAAVASAANSSEQHNGNSFGGVNSFFLHAFQK